MIDVSLVGVGGMTPLPTRHLASLAVRCNGAMLLVDCGEGTQVSLKQLGWGFKGLDYICFTHFHADHIAGLPGLLLTVGNSGRTEPITLVGPEGLTQIVQCLRVIAPDLPFAVQCLELPGKDPSPLSFSLGQYEMSALPLAHRIPCFGYNLSLRRAGRFDPERAKGQKVPMAFWSRLQKGETIDHVGTRYTPDMVLGMQRKGLKLSYITDTRPTPDIPDFVKDADLLICEGLYGDPDKQEKAASHFHMTFSEAAGLAQKGGVKELWLTHFSPAMPDPENYLDVAKAIFPRTEIGCDQMTKTLAFE